ncbi:MULTISPECIES: BrnA antitoxin family protein [unclassified Sphingomonas]|uniref:BrnA antitoxin family protein n=1 Tax=unclassified Sphingomonas TaxID=196159 RepID=UPI00226A9298|nr:MULTISPECIES: BrnA antitoxin family protein [unclassified Sphingomonas]
MPRPEDTIAIPADPDDPDDFSVSEAALQQALVERQVRMRGVQRAPTKQQVTLRLDPEVLAKFRATGRGWQARINAALKAAQV